MADDSRISSSENYSDGFSLEAARKVLDASPFSAWWGVRLTDVSPGRATLRLPWQEHFQRPGGVMQGACCMMLGDVATWIAMMASVENWEMAVTLEMKTNFLGPGRSDLWCEGWVIKAGRRSVFCEAATRDSQDKQVAHHTVTYLLP